MEYGYDTVIIRQYNTENNTLYRSTVQGYANRYFLKRGKKLSETILDGAGKRYMETLYEAQMADLNEGTPVGDGPCPAEAFPILETEIVNYYGGQAAVQLTTAKSWRYDLQRNVILYINYGDTSLTEDDLRATITYKKEQAHHLISLAESVIVKNQQGTLLRKRTALYNALGKPTKIVQHNEDNQSATELEYDPYGNVTKITFPENAQNQRMFYQYRYDPVVHTYPVRISNALNEYSTADYDYRFGKPTLTGDMNGNEMQYQYDYRGRTVLIKGPNEVETGAPYTIKMEYVTANNTGLEVMPNLVHVYSYATTLHYDVQHPDNPIRTTLFCDGFGRLLQTKKDAEIGGSEVSLVSGKVVYDCFGRTVKQYHPVQEALAQVNTLNNSYDPATLTRSSYDILDRQTKVVLPTGDSTVTRYGFEGGKFKSTLTDANGKERATLTDARGLQTRLEAPGNNVTSFVYNALGELTESKDPDGIRTFYTYNMLGQRTGRSHPDAGNDLYFYDAAGNMVAHATQNLLNNGSATEYLYHYNRLVGISYPDHPQNNIFYTYGSASATPNQRGKIVLQEDASGYQHFFYGKMGEITKNVRTFVLPNEDKSYTFTMEFEYDSWNRMQTITYPDNEKVNYTYNAGGLLKSVQGVKQNVVSSYLNNITYNQFEQKTATYYGNGSKTTYQYDVLQRLTRLVTYSGNNGEKLQYINYTYDKVNNIVSINNVADPIGNGMGGPYRYVYDYDNLYRLKSASGSWKEGLYSYATQMQYSPNGRITQKTQQAEGMDFKGYTTHFNYDYLYEYNRGQQPNTPHTVHDQMGQTSRKLNWDANGNLSFYLDDSQGLNRSLYWDEENRLEGVFDEKYGSVYQYDAAGERVYKLTGDKLNLLINGRWGFAYSLGEGTLYASAYLVATPKGYTKHYYAENERLASKTGGGMLAGILTPVVNEATYNAKKASLREYWGNRYAEYVLNVKEDGLQGLYNMENAAVAETEGYWYHSDHLGSSSWITNASGAPVQHLQYLPFGESFIDQRSSGEFAARYTFSAKEKDEETGYGYFGARYYSSDLSIWLGVDPMSDKYPSLSAYTYCANNPVKLIDPNGMEVIITGDQADQAYNSLQQGTNLKLSMDKNGKISASGDVMNDNDQQLYEAINSESVTVNIESSSQYSSGHYLGTTYNAETNTASSTNGVNLFGLSSLEKTGATGSGMMHEVTEGYQMGLIAIENKSNISRAAWMSGQTVIGSGNLEKTLSTQQYENPHDYSLYGLGHSRATRAPNEVNQREARNYKSPQEKYTLPIFTKTMNTFRSRFQGH